MENINENPNREPLPEVARLCLTAGRMLLEWGANARVVHEAISDLGHGYACDSSEAFCQHAAIIVMLRRGEEACSQMGKVGEHGVNLRRIQKLQEIITLVTRDKLSCAEAQLMMEGVPKAAKAYPLWFVCLATGIACSAFGRLLHADWSAFLPTMVAAGTGQWIRHELIRRGANIFLMAGIVSFVAASLAAIGGRLAGSVNLQLAMVAAVLLLVPGIPVLNAQIEVIEGKPNLAAARALRIAYLLLFISLGLALAQSLFIRTPLP